AAAVSSGIGTGVIGSRRKEREKVLERLEQPVGTIPVFGMVAGVPAHKGSIKERLPFEAIYQENTYQKLDKKKEDIEKYDKRISEYYKERTDGKREDTWSDQVIGMLNKKQRLDVDEVVKKQSFLGQ